MKTKTTSSQHSSSVLLFSLVLVILLATTVAAATKPISSTLTFNNGPIITVPITIHVSASGTGTPQECITVPQVNTGPKGSFATNLDNLVLKNAPSVRCNGLWAQGDAIWYSYLLNGKEFDSPKDTIKSGTGLQVLIPIDVDTSTVDSPSSPPSDSASGSSSSNSNNPSESKESLPSPSSHSEITLPNAKPDASQIELLLQSTPIGGEVRVTVFSRVTKGDMDHAQIRIELRKMPDNKLIDYREVETAFPATTNVAFDVSSLESGLYQVQATALQDNIIIAASAPDTFTLRRSEQEIRTATNFGGMAIAIKNKSSTIFNNPYFAFGTYVISFILILTALILFIYKKRYYATPIPVEIIGDSKDTKNVPPSKK